jgi:hypothetical protein
LLWFCGQCSSLSTGKPRDKHPRTGKLKLWASCGATAQVYLRHPGLPGCVAKTLLGRDCYAAAGSPPLTLAAARQAAERLTVREPGF